MNHNRLASPTLNRRISVICGAAFVSLALAVTAIAATSTAVQQQRHEHYEALGEAFKAVRDNSRGSPDFAALDKAVAVILKSTVEQAKWFPKGSGPEAGKTRAMPEIWSKPEDFVAAQKMFTEKAAPLATAVKSRDADGVGKAFRELGTACKNCHDNFRAPE